MMDLLGQALLDYHQGKYTEDPLTETNISLPEPMPLPFMFRTYEQMPPLEQKALALCRGRILDVGCGAGVHALHLQQSGFELCAIDRSPGAVRVSLERGVRDVRQLELLELSGETFDTILLLMNGTGIFGSLTEAPHYLQHLKKLLKPAGQILIDSSDLSYMYDRDEQGKPLLPEAHYHGELLFKISYQGRSDPFFRWLYLDFQRLKEIAFDSGFRCTRLMRGNHSDYLARLSPMNTER